MDMSRCSLITCPFVMSQETVKKNHRDPWRPQSKLLVFPLVHLRRGPHSGLKKWTGIPIVTMLQIAAATMRALRSIPHTPRAPLMSHIALYFRGFLTMIHMKQGYARVMGRAIPPTSPARLGRNGNAIDMKNARHPKETRKSDLSHRGQGLFLLEVYLNSRLSKTGIAYIWNELRLLITMSRLTSPSRNLGVSYLWYRYSAFSIPWFAGICGKKAFLSVLVEYILDHPNFQKGKSVGPDWEFGKGKVGHALNVQDLLVKDIILKLVASTVMFRMSDNEFGSFYWGFLRWIASYCVFGDYQVSICPVATYCEGKQTHSDC